MDANALSRENAHLKARLTEVEAALLEVQEANRRLEGILRASQRERFGKSSEKLSADQFNLPLEDAELAQGVLAAAQEKAEAALARARGDLILVQQRREGLHLGALRIAQRDLETCHCIILPHPAATMAARSAKLQSDPSSTASSPVKACQRSTATST